MAKVRMLLSITGGRADGTEWPVAGEILDCEDGEAWDLVRGRNAEAVDVPWEVAADGAEQAVAVPEGAPAPGESPDAQNGSESDGKPRIRDPKDVWEMHAVSLGATPELVAAMTKKDLIDQYGSTA